MRGEGPLRVTYLLAGTELFGGVKVVLHHANLLVRRGHRVRVVSPGERPDWYPLEAEFERVPSLDGLELPGADVTVATFWTTIGPAVEAATSTGGEVVHYCQGFEGDLEHNTAEHPAILAAYGRPIPALAVTEPLARMLRERFGRAARVVTPALEPAWRPGLRLGPRRRPRILVTGPFENYVKDPRTALEAVRLLRRRGIRARLVRLSQWPLTSRERELLSPDEFHCGLPPARVPALFRGCDLLLAPSTPQEGFGLPVLEALACGLPVAASEIPSFRWFAGDAALLVPPGDPRALAEAAESLLCRRRWRESRRRGLEVAERFRELRVVEELEAALRWVASGSWRGAA